MRRMSAPCETKDLGVAAFARMLGAAIVKVDSNRDGGIVALDLSRMSAALSRDLLESFSAQLQALPEHPTLQQVEDVMHNSFLGPLLRERETLKQRILNRR